MSGDELQNIVDWIRKEYPLAGEPEFAGLCDGMREFDWTDAFSAFEQYRQNNQTLNAKEFLEAITIKVERRIALAKLAISLDESKQRAATAIAERKQIDTEESRMRAIVNDWSVEEFDHYRGEAIAKYPHISTLNRPRDEMKFGTLSLVVAVAREIEPSSVGQMEVS